VEGLAQTKQEVSNMQVSQPVAQTSQDWDFSTGVAAEGSAGVVLGHLPFSHMVHIREPVQVAQPATSSEHFLQVLSVWTKYPELQVVQTAASVVLHIMQLASVQAVQTSVYTGLAPVASLVSVKYFPAGQPVQWATYLLTGSVVS